MKPNDAGPRKFRNKRGRRKMNQGELDALNNQISAILGNGNTKILQLTRGKLRLGLVSMDTGKPLPSDWKDAVAKMFPVE